MQISNNKKNKWLSVYLLLLCSTGGLIWFSQKSINHYWQQTYHTASPLEKLSANRVWQFGGTVQDYINQTVKGEKLPSALPEEVVVLEADQPEREPPAVSVVSEVLIPPVQAVEISRQFANQDDSTLLPKANTAVAASPTENEKAGRVLPAKKVVLKRGDKVFFAGDSLMQGVAPNMQKWLKEKQINSINLSKQSTGLAYPSFFDWPRTIEQTLNKYPDIKLLVVFLGPNDPWDMPAEQKNRPYLKFKSAEWESVYRKRVQRIVQYAKAKKVEVIWLGIPPMKKAKLNNDMRYLNQLIAQEVAQYGLFIPMDTVLSNEQNKYVDSIKVNGKLLRVRSKDGIHFSLSGIQVIADHLKSFMAF